MIYEIAFSKRSAKFLAQLPEKEFVLIQDKLQLLKQNPFRRDLDIVKLEGTKDAYRLRSGKIRLLFTIIKDKILIYFFDIGYRGDIYK